MRSPRPSVILDNDMGNPYARVIIPNFGIATGVPVQPLTPTLQQYARMLSGQEQRMAKVATITAECK